MNITWSHKFSAPTDRKRHAEIGVQDTSVLHAAAVTHRDRVEVGAEHRPVPDARFGADGDPSDERRTEGDEGGLGDVRAVVAERDQRRQASHGARRRLAVHRVARPATRRAVSSGASEIPSSVTRPTVPTISMSLESLFPARRGHCRRAR